MTLLIQMATNILLIAGQAWLLMLAIGIMHAEWIPALPTIGFWWMFVIWALIEAVLYSTIVAARTIGSEEK